MTGPPDRLSACPRAVAEGVLTEPAYFDFISFVQYATITKTMKEPKMIFNELIDANGISQTLLGSHALLLATEPLSYPSHLPG